MKTVSKVLTGAILALALIGCDDTIVKQDIPNDTLVISQPALTCEPIRINPPWTPLYGITPNSTDEQVVKGYYATVLVQASYIRQLEESIKALKKPE